MHLKIEWIKNGTNFTNENLIFVNKIDRIGVDIEGVLANIEQELSEQYIPLQTVHSEGETAVNVQALALHEAEENIEKIENSKNEWTLKRTFSRIIFYPFAIFIICFAIYGIYQGTVTRGIFGIFIAIAYLYTDIKIIRKKNEDF